MTALRAMTLLLRNSMTRLRLNDKKLRPPESVLSCGEAASSTRSEVMARSAVIFTSITH